MGRDMAMAKWRSIEATEMRLKGFTYDDIAEALEFKSRSGAWRAVHRNLSRLEEATAQLYLIQTLTDIDLLEDKYWPEAMAGKRAAMEKYVSLILAKLRTLKQLT